MIFISYVSHIMTYLLFPFLLAMSQVLLTPTPSSVESVAISPVVEQSHTSLLSEVSVSPMNEQSLGSSQEQSVPVGDDPVISPVSIKKQQTTIAVGPTPSERIIDLDQSEMNDMSEPLSSDEQNQADEMFVSLLSDIGFSVQ